MASSSSNLWKYDVFLSFHGEDTRRNFVSHFYRELGRLGIKAFKDDERLETGTDISDELVKAIKLSKFAVTIISKNYAFSRWCLQELAMIVECSRRGSPVVIPVFYEVDPSDVRNQKGNFQKAFKKHGKGIPDTVKRWKDALSRVGNTVGEHSKNWKDDAELIQKIVKDIFGNLNCTLPSDFSHFVGMNSHMEALWPLLNVESTEDVRVIGICGMGGIGKTTIARYIYKILSCRFQASCFIENVKDVYTRCGQTHLEEHFLSRMLREKDLNIPSSVEGSEVIKARLGHLKVLAVLDNIDKRDQLDILARKSDWFGPGSRIIVTSREKELLAGYPMYDVKLLSDDDAIQLFHQHAFGENSVEETFSGLLSRALSYAHGLPLALKVWGSFLNGKSKEEWEIAMFELERSFHQDIMTVLKVSYDGMVEKAKAIFLYIACYKQGHICRLVNLLNPRHPNVEFWIKILAQKSLIEISSGGCVIMHDLLQQMGREFARHQSIDVPGKRKILFDSTEIYDVLSNAMGTDTIEAISLNMSETNELYLTDQAFERMPNLRFLSIIGEAFTVKAKSLSYLPHKLISLEWEHYPLRTLPSRFHPECLVELILRDSNLERLWDGILPLWNLKKINLQRSRNLKIIPDLSMAPNLEELNCYQCSSLVDVCSTQGHPGLARLSYRDCKMLECLPSYSDMKALKYLDLNGCFSLKSFPEISPSIEALNLSFTAIEVVPSSIGHLSNLISLYIRYCRIRSLPSDITRLGKLEILSLYGCRMLIDIPKSLQKMKSLRTLHLGKCKRLQYLPKPPKSLRTITANGYSSSQRVAPSLVLPLQRLAYSNHSKLATNSDLPQMASIQYREKIRDCLAPPAATTSYSLTIPVAQNRRLSGFLVSLLVAIEGCSDARHWFMLKQGSLRTEFGTLKTDLDSYLVSTDEVFILGRYFGEPVENTELVYEFSLQPLDNSCAPDIKECRFRPMFSEDQDEVESDGNTTQSSSSYFDRNQEDLADRSPAAENQTEGEEELEPAFLENEAFLNYSKKDRETVEFKYCVYHLLNGFALPSPPTTCNC